MGLYTWISKYCCGEELQFQSKSGPKEWGEWDIDMVPFDVADDIDGDTQSCSVCGKVYKIQRSKIPYGVVPMEIVCVKDSTLDSEE